MSLLTRVVLSGALFAIAAAGLPSEADACGGMFCDLSPPSGTPTAVEQTGETIVFVVGGGFVEAHVQIAYDADDDARVLSWIVPVPAVPEIDVGSAQLLENLLLATVPVYGFETEDAVCDEASEDGGDVMFLLAPDGAGGGGGPVVLVEATVGAFDYVVLEGGTSQSVMGWLSSNGYADNDKAPAILDAYLDEGAVFVAFRLTAEAGVDDIHPIVIRYPGHEPCIPLRLTGIAAAPDMSIRALVLGEARAFPVNYRHVQLNRVRLDWEDDASNYTKLVTGAVDEAGGRAFVTEYAGPSSVVGDQGLHGGDALGAVALEQLSATEAIVALREHGILVCTSTCQYNHPLIAGLLARYIPVPRGVTGEAFYACVECYENLVDEEAWDPVAFAADVRERIVQPATHALELLEQWPYLTRLYTTISPHEMLSDPVFAEVPDLPDVPRAHGALRSEDCCGLSMRLPGGRGVRYEDGAWPRWNAAMPWAERVSEYQAEGPPTEILNQTATIDALVAEHNTRVSCDQPPGTTGGEPGATTTTTGGTGGSSGSGTSANSDTTTSDCACSSERSRPTAWAIALLGILVMAARRRR
ncbi:MAG: DUF2330 domain-containing protein [Nannocystaceae bacterium]|nr:DUF2330 domain-containing protein [Nannocystaceae bacterium]